MKTLKQLYTILYNDIKDETTIHGLCDKIREIYHRDLITGEEKNILKNHFYLQKYEHPEFMTKERNWNEPDSYTGMAWWWTSEEDSNPINRIAFIKKLMETVGEDE